MKTKHTITAISLALFAAIASPAGAQEVLPHRLWTDAYLAAFALAGGHRLVSFDSDFSRFPGLNFLHLTPRRIFARGQLRRAVMVAKARRWLNRFMASWKSLKNKARKWELAMPRGAKLGVKCSVTCL